MIIRTEKITDKYVEKKEFGTNEEKMKYTSVSRRNRRNGNQEK